MQTTVCLADGRALSSVLIVDDHPLYSDALAATMQSGFADCEVRTAGSLGETFEILDGGLEPDLLMLDLKLPDVTGISGFEKLNKKLKGTRVLVISSLASAELVRELLELGVMGFLPKESSVSTLRFAVNEVTAGRRYLPKEYSGVVERVSDDGCGFSGIPELSHLTPQQKRILKLICAGMPNKLIAYELGLAETTVKAHITALLRRLGVSNRTQAAVLVESIAQAKEAPEVRAFLKN